MCLVCVTVVAVPGDYSSFIAVQQASLGDMKQFLVDSKNLNADNVVGMAVLEDTEATYGVTMYTFSYESTDKSGSSVVNTAALLLPNIPVTDRAIKPTLIYNHGTVATNLEAPSHSKMCVGSYRQVHACTLASSDAARASLWAMTGYTVVLPDYEKLGINATAGTHPYCQRESYETSHFHLLRALLGIEASGAIVFDRRLVIAGYSEGGYATLASHKAMLNRCPGDDSNHGFRLIASFPYAGPFDIDFQVRHAVSEYIKGNYSGYWYIPYMIVAALDYYGKTALYGEVFEGAYATSVPPMYTRLHTSSMIEAYLPQNGSVSAQLFLPSVVQKFLSGSSFSGDVQTFVVEKNILLTAEESGCDSFSTVPVYFCSGSEDEQVPVANTLAAEKYFKAAGAKTTLDLFPGNHNTNAGNCMLVLTHYLNHLNWNASTALPERPASVPYRIPFWVLGAIAGFLFLQFFLPAVINGICLKLRGKQCHCVGPFGVWVIIMTRLPIVVLIIGIAIPVYVSFLGIQASNYTIDVDSDFANYLSADTVMKRNLSAYEAAQLSSSEKFTVSAVRRRQLSSNVIVEFGGIDFFYEAKDDSKGIFTKECLEEIKKFEAEFAKFPKYDEYCLKTEDNDECVIPLSPINLFYGSSGNAESGIYNGGGKLLDIDFVLNHMANTGVFWFTENDFGIKNLFSTLTRSHFDFGAKLDASSPHAAEQLAEFKREFKTWLKRVYDDFLDKTEGKYEHITVIYFEGNTLLDYEVNNALIHDSMWSLGSFAFVGLFVLIHLESPFLAFFAMGSILLSFPAGYAVFYIYFGVKKMMLLNFVALFLIMGIGADDAFVLFDTYKQAEAVLGPKSSKIKRMTWAYKEAGSAMLVTTVTTAGSFYANCFSTVRVVKEFGLFMGTVVVWNYINVMVIFPSAILVWESCCWCFKWKVIGRCFKKCCCHKAVAKSSPMKALQNSSKWKSVRKSVTQYQGVRVLTRLNLKHGHEIDVSKLSAPEKCCHSCYTTWLNKCRWFIAVFGILLVVAAAWLAQSSFTLASGTPTIFLENRNLGRFFKLMKTKLAGSSADDIKLASKAFPRSAAYASSSCPGNSVDGTVQCSHHGTCNDVTFECACHSGWAGSDCTTTSLRATVPKLSKRNVRWNEMITISSTNAIRICYSTIGPVACNLDGTCSVGANLEGASGTSNGITATVTFRVIGCQNAKIGHMHSSMLEEVVTLVNEEVESPIFSAKMVSHGDHVSITSSLSNYICYTVNNVDPACQPPSSGIPPSCSSGNKIFSGNDTVSGITANPTTIRAIGCSGANGRIDSDIVSEDIAIITVTAGDPTFGATTIHITESSGTSVVLYSANAAFLCYTIHYAGDVSLPACNSGGTNCLEGLFISGPSGETQGLVNAGTIYAMGCRNTAYGDLPSSVASQVITATYVVGQPSFVGSTSVVYGSTASITSLYADYICVSDSGLPKCQPPGTDGCIAGEKRTGTDDINNVLTVSSMSITGDATLKAVGCGATGDTNSDVSSGVSYTLITATASDPTFSPINGQLAYGAKVTIVSDNSVNVCFTTNGANPQCSGDGQCNIGLPVDVEFKTPAFVDSTGFGSPLKALGCANTDQSNTDSQITSINLVAVATEAGDPEFTTSGTIPGTLNFTGTMNLQISSADSSGVCYTTASGVSTPVVPSCLGSGNGCSVGSFLSSSPIPTFSDTTSTSAVGCGRSDWQNSPQADSSVITKVYVKKLGAGEVVFSATSGSHGDTLTLTSSTSTGICYGNDNTVQCSSNGMGCSTGVYANSFTLGSSTLRYYAMGCQDEDNGHQHSKILSQIVAIVITAAPPTFSGVINSNQILESTFPESKTVTIASANADNICYSIDGADPSSACTAAGECTAGFLSISGSTGATGVIRTAVTIKAKGCTVTPNLDSTTSSQVIANILYRAQDPTFTGAGSVVSSGGTVPIQSQFASYVCYTIDGNIPTCATNGCGGNSLLVANGVTQALNVDCTIRAIGCMDKSTLTFQEDSAVKSHSLSIQTVTAQRPSVAAQTVAYNSRLTITSIGAVSICYTSGTTAGTTADPGCSGPSACTSVSTKITGSSGSTVVVTSAGVLKAIGCADTHSNVQTIPFAISPIVATMPTILGDNDAGNNQYTVTIKSTNAISICYGSTSSIACTAAGSCNSGTEIASTNDQVPTTALGTYAYGATLWAISCGRTSIYGSSDSEKIFRTFQAPVVATTTSVTTSTVPPTTTAAAVATPIAPTDAPSILTCKNDCSGSGTCSNGVCTCMSGYDREDCSVKLVPVGDSVEFSLLFGVDGYDPKNSSLYSFKPDFDAGTLAAQRYLLGICESARKDVELKVRGDFQQGCWVQSFSRAVPTFPITPAFFPASFQQFMVNTQGVFKSDVETTANNYKGKILWLSLRFRLNAAVADGAFALQPLYLKWKKFMDETVNPGSPAELGPAQIVSAHFTSMDTEIAIIMSTVESFLMSNAICLGAVLIFTGDLAISLYTMFAIMMIVVTLLGFLFGVMGFSFGAIEAVGVTIFVGMSVDYCLHLAHGYHHSEGKTRVEKLRDAMTHLGVSIVMGAITTGGAASFLLMCYLYLFFQLGVMMLMNTLLALFFSLVYLAAVLAIAGPTNNLCYVYAWPRIFCRCLFCCCLKSTKRNKSSSVAPVEDNSKIFYQSVGASRKLQSIAPLKENINNIPLQSVNPPSDGMFSSNEDDYDDY